MKLLCPGAYTWNNKGDAALVLAMVAELRRVFSQPDITVLSDTPELDSDKYPAHVLPPLVGGTLEYSPPRSGTIKRFLDRHLLWRAPSFGRAFTYLAALVYRGIAGLVSVVPAHIRARIEFYIFLVHARIATALLGKKCHRLFPPAQARVVRGFCEADAVVMVPGGYLIAPHPQHTHWLRHIAALVLARWLRKPAYLYACTLGPFHGGHNRWWARAALSRVDAIILREPSSEEAAARIAPHVPRILTTDAAFVMPGCPPDEVQSVRGRFLGDSRQPIIGISVREYRFPGHTDPAGQRTRYLDAMAAVAKHLAKKHNGSVYFVPQVLADEISDIDVARDVLSRIDDRSSIQVIDAELSPSELRGLYSCFDAFVGVRMHANIFALCELVPTVAIAYEPKTAGIMKYLGLGDYVLDIRTVDAQALIAKVDILMGARTAIREQLKPALGRAKSMAARTADFIGERLVARGLGVGTVVSEAR